jgi:Domain of unknown function (DUF4062)
MRDVEPVRRPIVKVFISSVRRGLEEERDSLPGLLRALGHEPLRFEEFTAQSRPSREACLNGVAAADVYLLLLGPAYGDPLPETGKSPTEEEYVAARVKGIPRLVFRKNDVEFEPLQETFVRNVESYSTGLFRNSFDGAVDLQAKVATALRDLPTSPGLDYAPLTAAISIEWRADWEGRQPSQSRPVLEVHAVPVGGAALSTRQLRELAERLPDLLRQGSAVGSGQAISHGSDSTAAWALPASPAAHGNWRDPRPATLLGVRVARTGQRSAWLQLAFDSLGTILDPDDLGPRIARLLRLLGSLALLGDERYAIAAGIQPTFMVTAGSIDSLGRRTSSQMMGFGDGSERVAPDESVSATGLDQGADEVGRDIARTLGDRFGPARR